MANTTRWLQEVLFTCDEDTLITLIESKLSGLVSAGGGDGATKSSGTTAVATSSDTAVTLIAADATQDYYHLRVMNEGSVSGFVSVDGTVWHRLPAFSIIEIHTLISNSAVQVKREAGGDNLSDVFGSLY